jgi:transposase InsO family protein
MKKVDPSLPVERVCQLCNVPIASYYYKPSDKSEEESLHSKMNVIHTDNLEAYGRRRMKTALISQGIQLGEFKIARLMKDAGIIAKIPKKPHYYPKGKELPNIPNLLKRQFNPEKANTHWVGDITYIRSHQGWSYLATVLDLGTREIVGYALSQTPDAQLAKQALINAIKMHKPNTHELMFHSDQGVQYAANLFKKTLSLQGITQSMSRRGNCWDNAVQERFFRSLKSEYLNGLSFINHQSVVKAVEFYIRYYNNKRISSVIGYITPVQKRSKLLNVA